MNFPQFVTTLVLAIAFAGLSIWTAAATQTNTRLLTEQVEMQKKIENAQAQQRVLSEILKRTAILGQQDSAILSLLSKYGLSIKTETPAATPAPTR